MEDINYTITSTNESNYSYTETNLFAPPTMMTTLTTTCLTCNCTIVVLDVDDFITINGKQYQVNDRYTALDPSNLKELLNTLFGEDLRVEVAKSQQLVFEAAVPFTIETASYRMKIITGLKELPISSTDNKIVVQTVGDYLSTPVLYLESNIGQVCFQNVGNSSIIRRIAMRVNNSFATGVPIIVTNAEFSQTVPSSSLSYVWFKLVDSNFVQVKLLSPMEIFCTATPVIVQLSEEERQVVAAINYVRSQQDQTASNIAGLEILKKEAEA